MTFRHRSDTLTTELQCGETHGEKDHLQGLYVIHSALNTARISNVESAMYGDEEKHGNC